MCTDESDDKMTTTRALYPSLRFIIIISLISAMIFLVYLTE